MVKLPTRNARASLWELAIEATRAQLRRHRDGTARFAIPYPSRYLLIQGPRGSSTLYSRYLGARGLGISFTELEFRFGAV